MTDPTAGSEHACQTCVFYVERPDLQTDFDSGECHFNAPVPTFDVEPVQWPLVRADTFCGQWQDVW